MGSREGPLWAAFSRAEQGAFATRVAATRDTARTVADRFRVSAEATGQVEADQRRAAEQARRAQVLEDQRIAREQAAAQRRAEVARAAAATASRSSGSTSSSESGDSSGSGSSTSDGYTGPRCYEPGGKVYRPCCASPPREHLGGLVAFGCITHRN